MIRHLELVATGFQEELGGFLWRPWNHLRRHTETSPERFGEKKFARNSIQISPGAPWEQRTEESRGVRGAFYLHKLLDQLRVVRGSHGLKAHSNQPKVSTRQKGKLPSGIAPTHSSEDGVGSSGSG